MAARGVKTNMQRTPHSRVWIIQDGAAPHHVPKYKGLSRITGITVNFGDVTPTRVPDPDQYGRFIVVDKIRGEPGLPTTTLQSRMERVISDLLKLSRDSCEFSVQAHIGVCQNPQDFNGGWEKVHVFERAVATQYTSGELGALDQGQDATIDEEIAITAEDYYEVVPLLPAELAANELVQEVIAVAICDSKQCGICGLPSDGCQRILAVTKSAGGSPGLPAEVVYSANQGGSFGETIVSTLAANHDPSDATCVGVYFVVVSNSDDAIHYALLSDIFNGEASWTKVITGIVGAGSPNAIFSVGSAFTWMVGDGGYIYFTSDPTSGFEVQSAGAQTAQNLADIHGMNEFFLVAVGASNAVVYSQDGGSTWSSVTGPNPGVALTSVYVKDENIWFVTAADGTLWYTSNQGVSWSEKAFPGSGSGVSTHIDFATDSVGYLAHQTTATKGRILRTIDGGQSWYVLSEKTGIAIPGNDKVNVVAACGEDANLVLGGGLADDAVDGFLVKFS